MNNLRNSNTILSNLTKKQKLELLEYICSFKYKYSNSINLDKNLRFGIEIETEKGYNHTISNYMQEKYKAIKVASIDKIVNDDYSKWQISYDGSLKNGIELSSPIYSDQENTWLEIQDVCQMLKSYHAIASDKTGAHIHFNATFIGEDVKRFVNLLKLYAAYENILIKFGYGPSGKARPELFKYAKVIADDLFVKMYSIEHTKNIVDLGLWVSHSKNTSMNLCNVNWLNMVDELKNTIEFRSPNGTINPIIWQNLVNTYGHLLMATKNIDEEFIKYKLSNYYFKNFRKPDFYDAIFFDEALELVDIIFDNNYDKVMFLKQYINNYDYSEYQDNTQKIIIKA